MACLNFIYWKAWFDRLNDCVPNELFRILLNKDHRCNEAWAVCVIRPPLLRYLTPQWIYLLSFEKQANIRGARHKEVRRKEIQLGQDIFSHVLDVGPASELSWSWKPKRFAFILLLGPLSNHRVPPRNPSSHHTSIDFYHCVLSGLTQTS